MGTKSKNSFIYSIVFTLAILLLGYSTLTTTIYCIYSEQLKEKSYFETNEFLMRLEGSVIDLQQYYVTYDFLGYEDKSPEEKISKDELDKTVEEHNKAIEKEIQNITDNYRAGIYYDNTKTAEQMIAERDKAIEDYERSNRKSVEEIKKELIESKDNVYEILKHNVNQWKSLKYYLINKSNGEVYTNLPSDVNIDQYLKKEMIYYDKYPKEELITNFVKERISRNLAEQNLEGHFLIPKEGTGYSEFYLSDLEFTNRNNRIITEAKLGALAFLISIILFAIVSRREKAENTILENLSRAYVRIPMEIRLAILIVPVGIFGSSLVIMPEIHSIPYWAYVIYIIGWSAFLIYTFLHIRGLYHLITNPEFFKSQRRETIICRIFSWIAYLFNRRKTLYKVTVVLLASIFFGFAVLGLFLHHTFFIMLCFMYIVAYISFVSLFVYKRALYFNDVVKGSNSIAEGNFDLVIEEKGNDAIKVLAHNFNNIKNGYKASMAEQIKSERLKTELITNVSHDLKTPLTSIINYVDLLKNQDLSEEEKDSYIEILDRKSQRLKVLIDDLFEASKMSSGAVELEREQVDIAAILRQTLGELDEKINKSSLVFRANIPAEKIYLYLDGKKTWRVFENLINNALKYSQPNTRVYIDLLDRESSVLFIIKNVANYEMDFDPEEIFERFKRGDKSRNTEGSGLGLAIARSIVELQQGKMNIEIDGDLFKVIVEFKKM
ncbi:MAG: sensor histidine kinase [Clostridia bacterium]|nr:sensor histidine kinase [Clostridia bacterium]